MKITSFDDYIERRGSSSTKYDGCQAVFHREGLLPMWIADMDFPTPDFVIHAIRERLKHPVLAYFLRSEGFYKAVSGWMWRRHRWAVENDWISFSPGVVTGLTAAVQAYTKPGDAVLIQPPVYYPFYSLVENQGRKIVCNPLRLTQTAYEMDFEDLEAKLKKYAPKMLLLCNPHNPVGRCWNAGELEHLGALCLKYHCLVVSDEIHSDLLMDGCQHQPFPKLSEALAMQSLCFVAPSKTFNMAGLSTSAAIIPNPALRERFKDITENVMHISLGTVFGDVALEAAYTHGDEWVDALRHYLTENIRYAEAFIAGQIPVLKSYLHEATYLLWVDFRQLHLSREALNSLILDKAGLALDEGGMFGIEGEGFMRFNLACPRSTVETAMHALKKAVESQNGF